MKNKAHSAPDSMTKLLEQNSLLQAQFSDLEARFTEREKHYKQTIALLEEQVDFLKDKLFGRKADEPSADSRQFRLFEDEEPEEEPPPEEVKVPSYTRKKPGRKPLPENLPRVDRIYDIEESEKKCSCGCEKSCIGQEVTEQLDYIPARIQVIRHIRLKYACKGCEGLGSTTPPVVIAPAPVQLIEKSIASSGLLAHVLTAKFVDALPFYRQEKQFSRLGITLKRATMCNWALKVAAVCEPLYDLLYTEIRSGPLINIDETTLKVLSEKQRSKCYMWVFCGGNRARRTVLYKYGPGRSGQVAKDVLADYRGYIQTDGYKGYDFLSQIEGVTLVGCWAHARRKFVDVTKIKGSRGSSRKQTNAMKALKYIQKLYHIEHEYSRMELSRENFQLNRSEAVQPILEEFLKFLTALSDRTPPKGVLGKAVSYALGQWPRLEAYLDQGYISPDNNRAENAIRPFVVGRKNWLFSGIEKGAEASALFFSLIETAKANDIEPYTYLKYIFDCLPYVDSPEEYKLLLPQYLDKKYWYR